MSINEPHGGVYIMAIGMLNQGIAYHGAPVQPQPVKVETNSSQSVSEAPVSSVEVRPITVNSNAKSGNEEEQERQQPSNAKKIQNAVNSANTLMKHARTRCEFSYHEETKRISIKVIDKDTEETIREIPPEETLEMVEKMWELAGIMIDERR